MAVRRANHYTKQVDNLFYNNLIKFGISKKLVISIKMYLSETYSRVHIPYIREYSAPSNNPCTLILREEILKINKNGFN